MPKITTENSLKAGDVVRSFVKFDFEGVVNVSPVMQCMGTGAHTYASALAVRGRGLSYRDVNYFYCLMVGIRVH